MQSLFFDRYSIDTARFTRDGNQVIVTGDRNFFKVYDMIDGKIMQIPMIRGACCFTEPFLVGNG